MMQKVAGSSRRSASRRMKNSVNPTLELGLRKERDWSHFSYAVLKIP